MYSSAGQHRRTFLNGYGGMMSALATHEDANLILKLYDLRREPVMREARKFVGGLNITSADQIVALYMDFASEQNAYLRQATSFWEMAASLVLHGALNEGLFLDNAGELFFIYAKFHPYIAEIREKLQAPGFLAHSEKLIHRSPEAQDRLRSMLERQRMMAQRRAEAQK
jgi:hypothetical protein